MSEADLMKAPGTVTHRKIVVTHKAVLGKTLAERGLDHLYNVAITLFLACVGLKAGAPFFRTVFTPEGLWWIISAVGIAMIPLLAVALIGRAVLKLNFMTLSGLMAGSMTDPPALAFANAISKSDAPSVAYATVYPLTMLLRILAAQIMTLLFTR